MGNDAPMHTHTNDKLPSPSAMTPRLTNSRRDCKESARSSYRGANAQSQVRVSLPMPLEQNVKKTKKKNKREEKIPSNQEVGWRGHGRAGASIINV